MKRLHLLRHAKSSWDDPGLDDHERPLAKRGRRAAAALAGWLEENGVRPEVVLCSTSARTRQTLELVLAGLGDPAVSYEDGLYLATATELLARLHGLPDDVGAALVVGHNPGLQDLALKLAAPSSARERIAAKLPTGSLVVLGADVGSWADLAARGATAVAVVTPRDLS